MSPSEIISIIGTLVGIAVAVVALLMYLNPPTQPSAAPQSSTQSPGGQPTSTQPPCRSNRQLILRSVIVLNVIVVIVSLAFFSAAIVPSCCKVTPTPASRTGKPTGSSASFVVYPNYNPSGYVGDTGDIIAVAKESSLVRFT